MKRSIRCFITVILVMTSVTLALHNVTYISNLTARCLYCLCKTSSNCRMDVGCEEGFCGPFQISAGYWSDATAGTYFSYLYDLKNYSICANDYYCAVKIVKLYISKYVKDCNKDGVTDCLDFGMINYNAGPYCHASLHKTPASEIYGNKLINCTGHKRFY